MNGWCLDYYEYLHSAYHTLFYVESAKQRYIRKGRCVLIACSDNYRSFSLALHGDSFPFEKDFIFSCVCCRWIYSYERRRLQGSGEGFGASRAVITGGCELPDLGADAWTWVLQKTCKCSSLLSQLSAPTVLISYRLVMKNLRPSVARVPVLHIGTHWFILCLNRRFTFTRFCNTIAWSSGKHWPQ